MKASLTKSDKTMVPIIIGLSIVVPVVVIILMNLPTRYNLLGLDVGTFPFSCSYQWTYSHIAFSWL